MKYLLLLLLSGCATGGTLGKSLGEMGRQISAHPAPHIDPISVSQIKPF